MLIRVSEIKKGDRFGVTWEAISDAKREESFTVVEVRFADGGVSERKWNNPSHRLEIKRG